MSASCLDRNLMPNGEIRELGEAKTSFWRYGAKDVGVICTN